MKISKKDYTIFANIVDDLGTQCLAIRIEQRLNKNQWKNRLLLFNSTSAAYRNFINRYGD